MESIRYLAAAAVIYGFKMYHLDVETAFLNGNLEEEIYMEIPEGFKHEDRRSKVLRLLKSIYGLKQAGRNWNILFTDTIIEELGFKMSSASPCVFIKVDKNGKIVALLGIFVDDCFLAASPEEASRIAAQLMKIFKMHNLGLLKFALGIKFDQLEDGSIRMSQPAYVENLLEKFNMQDCRVVDTPLPIKNYVLEASKPMEDINLYQQLVGSLIYLSNSTRPDIAYAIRALASVMHAPAESDFASGKRVLRYLKGTKFYGLNFNNKNQHLFAYSDSSYAEEKDLKSVGGYVTMCGGAAVSWKSTKQPIIAQSSMEAEYIAIAETAKEIEWFRKHQLEFFPNPTISESPTVIFEDNQSAIKLANNPIHSNRSKHINMRYHKIQELVANKIIDIQYLPTSDMVADIMTKSLAKVLHTRFVEGMGLIDTSKE